VLPDGALARVLNDQTFPFQVAASGAADEEPTRVQNDDETHEAPERAPGSKVNDHASPFHVASHEPTGSPITSGSPAATQNVVVAQLTVPRLDKDPVGPS
jgi:hypothetical protein